MKIALVLLAVLGLACAASISVQPATRTLEDDWIEFVTLIPRGPIINILVNHLATDADFQQIILYLITDEFEALVVELDAEPDFLNVLDYLEAQDLAVYDFLNVIHDFLGLPLIPPPGVTTTASVSSSTTTAPLQTATTSLETTASGRVVIAQLFELLRGGGEAGSGGGGQRGWPEMWAEIVAVWPTEEVRAFHADKLDNSAEYRELFDALAADEFRVLLNKMIVLPSWQHIVEKLISFDINVDSFTQWLRNLLGWTL